MQKILKLNTLLISIAILTIVSSISSCKSKNTSKIAKKGIIDISAIDWNKTDFIELNGQWEFVWKKLLTPSDFNKIKNISHHYITIPSEWSDNEINNNQLTSNGYGTYRLLIKHSLKEKMAVKVNFPSTAYKLYINSQLTGQVGIISQNKKDSKPQFRSMVYPFIPENKDIEIIIQVSNYHLNVGGVLQPVYLGPEDTIQKLQDNAIAFDIFLFGCLAIIGLYHIILYILRRKDPVPLWFGLSSIILALRSLVINEHYLYQFFKYADFQKLVSIDFIVISIGIPSFAMYIESLFKEYAVPLIRYILFGVTITYSIFVLLTTSDIYSQFVFFIQIIILLACLYFFYIIIRARIDKRSGSKTIIAAFLIIFIAVLNDILAAQNYINSPQLTSFALLAFLISQSVLISKNFSTAFKRVEELSSNLEGIVEERTMELETERNLLKKRNYLMEKDLQLAKKIQQQIIPRISPVDFIETLYKPVDMVGGDFYDFLRFRDINKIGIFICDASGHGVPAAFIISMIKTILLQSASARSDPAQLFHDINSILYGNSNGYFITAFYGIYDSKSRELHYSNAAHAFPYLVSDNGIKTLEGHKSVPLGIMDNDDLTFLKKNYISSKTIISEDISKIFLLTDGILEGSSIDDQNKFFGEEALEQSLFRHHSMNNKDFMKAIYKDLSDFCKTQSFEDDICMISVDVSNS